MNINIGVSNRHVHLTEDDFILLFGSDYIEKLKDLKQIGEFSSTSLVTIKTDKSSIENVRVLGPFRKYTQVEISKTDSYKLGINPPIRNSGELFDAEKVTIVGPAGSITKNACIIATRHIHINPEDRKNMNLENVEYVSVEVGKEKSAILQKVFIKESQNGVFELHLDTDDANSNLLKSGDIAKIII